MATLDRQIPSPDSFLCEPWSSFVSVAQLRVVDNADTDSSLADGDHAEGVQPIGRQEMFVHSHFPALEDFSLVVCNVCNKVVTPQGMLSHYGKTHTHTRTHTYIYSSPTRHHHHTLTRHTHTHKHSQRLSCLAL